MTRVPELRFDGFEGEWENLNLSNITERITRKNNELISNLPLTISAELGLVNQLEYYNFRVASKDVSNYYLIYNGEFAYNKSTSKDAPFGAIKRLDRYEHGVLSTLYIAFKVKNSNSNFMKYYFETAIWNNHIYKISQEGARNHGLLNLNVSDFFDMPVNLPIITYEQEKIGDLFSKIDQLIESQQELIDQTIVFKKSMLQKMFPKKDYLVPEFRFDGFNRDWREDSISNLLEYRRGSFPQPYTYDKWYNGKDSMPFVQVNDVEDNSFLLKEETNKKISKLAMPKSIFVPMGTIVVTIQGTIGRVAKTQYDSYVDRTLMIIKNKKIAINDYFLMVSLFRLFYEEKYKASGGTIKSLTSKKIGRFIIKIPSLEEQEKIGNFFKKLDEKIAREEKLLDAYKDMKKSLLQKMFV